MATQISLRCHIGCLEDKLLSEILFLQCGHYLCTACHEKINKPQCPLCRLKITSPPHRIYLDPGEITYTESTETKQPHVLNALDKINKDTPANSIEEAGVKVKKLHESEGNDPDVSAQILRALQNLERRIAPMFKQLDEVKELSTRLQEQLKESELSRAKYREKVLRSKREIEKGKAETERQRQRADKYLALVKEKEVNLQKLQDVMTSQERETRLLKTKLKALSKGQKPKPRLSSDADASLLIEGAPESSTRIKVRKLSKTSLQDLNTEPPPRRTHTIKEMTLNKEDNVL